MLEALEKLCRHAAQVFPLKYQSDVELLGGPILGAIPGFGSSKISSECS
jgi:hypothetical protein